jgi:hypothetical protein
MQTSVRSLLSVMVGVVVLSLVVPSLVVLSLPAPAFAGDYFVKNDSMGDSFQGQIATAEIIADEIYAATFTIPASWQLPVELEGVRVLMVDGNDSSKTYCGRFSVEVWEESPSSPTGGGQCPNAQYKDPGPVTYSMSTQFQSSPIGYEIAGNSSNWQDMRFSTVNNDPSLNVTINPVMLNTRSVRVGIKALDKNCSMTANANAFPLMVTDDNGVSTENFLFGTADFCSILGPVPPPEFYMWKDFAPYFQATPGDFVMRLIFDRPDQGGGDVGVDAGMDAGFDAGKDTGDDTSGDTDVDATPADVSQGDIGADVTTADAVDAVGNADTTSTADTATQALAITSVSPSSMPNDQSTNIAIVGRGFDAGAQVLLGAEAVGVTETRSGLIRATVPEGFAVGMYDVIVTNPGGDTAVLDDGVEVVEPGANQVDAGSNDDLGSSAQPNSDSKGAAAEGCGCRMVGGPGGMPLGWVWLVGLGVVAMVGCRWRLDC